MRRRPAWAGRSAARGRKLRQATIDRGPVTAYFRRWFTVDNPSVQTRMILELMYDDGIVVHLIKGPDGSPLPDERLSRSSLPLPSIRYPNSFAPRTTLSLRP